MTKDKIIISGLSATTFIGVTPDERRQKTKLRLDATLFFDINRAAKTDDLTDTIDYGQVVERLKQYIADSQCALLETLATGIIQMVQDEFHPQGVHLRVLKPNLLNQVDAVGIELERRFD